MANPEEPQAPRAAVPAGFRRWALLYLALGLVVSLLLLGAKLLVEQTPLGRWAGQETRSMLVGLLPAFRDRGPDAIVIDISNLPGGTLDPASGRLLPTPRAELRRIVEVLSELGPAGIGIDIDFSGTERGWIDDDDPGFFDLCLTVNRRLPVRLGVWRGISGPPEGWLVLPQYQPLAAAIYFRDTADGRLPIWVAPEGAPERLLTLGASLAAARKPVAWAKLTRAAGGSSAAGLIFDDITSATVTIAASEVRLQMQEALVNHSVLPQLARESIPYTGADALRAFGPRIANRFVLVGDVSRAADRFVVPGDRRNQPGVLLHAAQAHTIASEPVYELGHGFRVLVDVGIPVLIMLTVVALRGASAAVEVHRAERWLMSGALFLVVLAAVGGLLAFRVFWTDFILLAGFLLLHRPLEHVLRQRLQAAQARTAGETGT